MSRTAEKKVFAGKTLTELEALTADLDREFVVDTFGPMTPAARRLWERAKRKRGRPRVGKGAKVVSVSIERDLLARSDRLAKRLKVSRAKLVAAGLERVLAEAGPRTERKSRAGGPRRRRRAA